MSFAALMTPSLTWNAPELPVRKQAKAPAHSLAFEQVYYVHILVDYVLGARSGFVFQSASPGQQSNSCC